MTMRMQLSYLPLRLDQFQLGFCLDERILQLFALSLLKKRKRLRERDTTNAGLTRGCAMYHMFF